MTVMLRQQLVERQTLRQYITYRPGCCMRCKAPEGGVPPGAGRAAAWLPPHSQQRHGMTQLTTERKTYDSHADKLQTH